MGEEGFGGEGEEGVNFCFPFRTVYLFFFFLTFFFWS